MTPRVPLFFVGVLPECLYWFVGVLPDCLYWFVGVLPKCLFFFEVLPKWLNLAIFVCISKIYMEVRPETKISTLGVLPQTNISTSGLLPLKNKSTLGVIYSAKSCPRFTPKTYLGVLPEIKISTLGVLPECLYWLCGSHILDLYILSIPLPVSAF